MPKWIVDTPKAAAMLGIPERHVQNGAMGLEI